MDSSLTMIEFIRTELIMLELHWLMFKQLYDSGSEVARLLDKSASMFFSPLHMMFLDNIVLRIAKLTDRANIGGRDTISFLGLQEYLTEGVTTTNTIKQKLSELLDECKPIRDIRNQVVSHHDKNLKLGIEERTLGAPKEVFESSINRMKEIYDSICDALGFEEHRLGEFIPQGTASELIRRLRHAEMLEELYIQRRIPDEWLSGLTDFPPL